MTHERVVITPSRCSASYTLGLFFIFLVTIIWATSSVLVQYLYSSTTSGGGSNNNTDSDDKDDIPATTFHSPFLLTFIGASLFSLWLPFKAFTNKYCHTKATTYTRIRPDYNNNHPNPNDGTNNHETFPNTPYMDVVHRTDSSEFNDGGSIEETIIVHNNISNNNNDVVNLQPDNNNQSYNLDASNTHLQEHVVLQPVTYWTHRQHFQVAVKIAPIWFIANYAYNAALLRTSISSSTVLASTGSLFTFLFAVSTGDENFNCMKLSGVLLGFTGSLITAMKDSENNTATRDQDEESFVGDLLALLSAIGYGIYAVQIRLMCPHNESMYSMQIILGYIGLINMILFSPIALYQVFEQHNLTWFIFGFVVVKGMIDNVLSDYLWLRAVIMTSATIATVGLGLTIPLAFFSDYWLGTAGVLTFRSYLGALAVMAGFVLVNLGNEDTNVDQFTAVIIPEVDTCDEDEETHLQIDDTST